MTSEVYDMLKRRVSLDARCNHIVAMMKQLWEGNAVNLRSLQLSNCTYWRLIYFSTEWTAQSQYVCVCVLFCLE
jgi:hypothetical protein